MKDMQDVITENKAHSWKNLRQLIINKDAITIQWEKQSFQQTLLRQWISTYKEWSKPYFIYVQKLT